MDCQSESIKFQNNYTVVMKIQGMIEDLGINRNKNSPYD